ncbi:hypothetical protein KGP36_02280 [Patescibacteria group bacterium]|nr:hypothetical protein [Patescibacteria group bacterium]
MQTVEEMIAEATARTKAAIQEAADAVAKYDVVRSIPEHPGWIVMHNVLLERAKIQREQCQDILDRILSVGRTESLEIQFREARAWLLGLETAIQLWTWIRDRALEGKNILDNSARLALDSQQNGQGPEQ